MVIQTEFSGRRDHLAPPPGLSHLQRPPGLTQEHLTSWSGEGTTLQPAPMKNRSAFSSKNNASALKSARVATENMMMDNGRSAKDVILNGSTGADEHWQEPDYVRAHQELCVWNFAVSMACQEWWTRAPHWALPEVGYLPTCAANQSAGYTWDSELWGGFLGPQHSPNAVMNLRKFNASKTTGTEEAAEPLGALATPPHLWTTVMMRNIPNDYTQAMLLHLLNAEGFGGSFDLFYLPIDFRKKVANFGYGFVNLVDPASAKRFQDHFSGFCTWSVPSDKVCQVTWSNTLQGIDANVERYRNCPVMHKSVPDEWKPVLFKEGTPTEFPVPTKRVRAPPHWPQGR